MSVANQQQQVKLVALETALFVVLAYRKGRVQLEKNSETIILAMIRIDFL